MAFTFLAPSTPELVMVMTKTNVLLGAPLDFIDCTVCTYTSLCQAIGPILFVLDDVGHERSPLVSLGNMGCSDIVLPL